MTPAPQHRKGVANNYRSDSWWEGGAKMNWVGPYRVKFLNPNKGGQFHSSPGAIVLPLSPSLLFLIKKFYESYPYPTAVLSYLRVKIILY